MAAAFFFPRGGSQIEGLGLEPTLLGIWVAVATLLITGLAIVVTLVDRRLAAAAASERVSRSRMLTAIESGEPEEARIVTEKQLAGAARYLERTAPEALKEPVAWMDSDH